MNPRLDRGDFALSAAGERAFYLADQERDGRDELFTTSLPHPHRGAR
jgi:hypothetical protein